MIPHLDLFLVTDHTPNQVLAPPSIQFQHLEGPTGCKQKDKNVFFYPQWLIIDCSCWRRRQFYFFLWLLHKNFHCSISSFKGNYMSQPRDSSCCFYLNATELKIRIPKPKVIRWCCYALKKDKFSFKDLLFRYVASPLGVLLLSVWVWWWHQEITKSVATDRLGFIKTRTHAIYFKNKTKKGLAKD